jgi:acetyl esterase/lipase
MGSKAWCLRSSVLLFALGLRAAQGADPPPITTAYDVPYATAGGVELQLDLAQPARGNGPFPAVLVIHGGAWREGGKEENRRLLIDFARRGYVAVSPEYRFCPKDTFPAQVHDVKAAVRFLRANASSLKIDSQRIGAMGFSAGAHLALFLGLTGPEDGLEGEAPKGAPSSRVQAIVDFYGPTDLSAADFSDQARSLIRDFLGGSMQEKRELAAKASPVTFVSAGDAPVLVFQGTRDPLVPHSQSVRLLERLAAAGVPGRIEFLLGAGHDWQEEEWEHAIEETFKFFDQHLKKRSSPSPSGSGGARGVA